MVVLVELTLALAVAVEVIVLQEVLHSLTLIGQVTVAQA
jgi:hypothetical protein